jgi:glutamine amidotransferase-like uncharacterized protein
MFVMPGGADLPFCEALNGAPNQHIRCFVEEGGVYLGICAGAYYACREIAFHAGTDGAICGARELRFVDAVAVGSLPQLTGGIAYDATPRSAAAVEILTTDRLTAAPITLHAHYHGGCRFDFGDATGHNAKILAVYTGLAGAPRLRSSSGVGKGRAILSGVHLEMSGRECKDALCGHSDMAEHVHVCHKLSETGTARLEVLCPAILRLMDTLPSCHSRKSRGKPLSERPSPPPIEAGPSMHAKTPDSRNRSMLIVDGGRTFVVCQ